MSHALILAALAAAALSAAAPPARAADDPRQVLREVRKLPAKDAVDEQRFVTLGGVPQWISVRARHRGAPILLVIHGGPGFTLSPSAHYYMRDWEEFFTVVQWDQRGAGKSYGASDPEAVRATLKVDRFVADAEELVAMLRQTYGQERIAVLGHSWGSIVGVKLAQRRPEWLSAYVGVGQFVDFQKNEALGYQATLADARAAGDAEAVAALEAIAPFPDPARPERNFANLRVERRWLAKYGGYYAAGGEGHDAAISRLSPDFTAEELAQRDKAQGVSAQAMWAELGGVDLTGVTRLDCPVVILQGRHDRGTNADLAAAWLDTLQAPSKRLVWFEDSAHMPFEEEPGRFLVALVEQVLPLTKAGPAKP